MILTVGVAVAGSLLLGCGSGGGDGASAPVSKAEYINQVNAICAKTSEQAAKAAAAWEKEHSSSTEHAEAELNEAIKELFVPLMRNEVEGLEALPPPSNDSARADRMIRRLSTATTVLGEEGWRGLTRSRYSQFQREAAAYGVERCLGLLYQ